MEIISVGIGLADGPFGVGAVVLVVRHWFYGGKCTAEVVVAADADVDDPFGFFQKVFAVEVASVVGENFVSNSFDLAIGVLNTNRDTL